jgi:hypothetical protein
VSWERRGGGGADCVAGGGSAGRCGAAPAGGNTVPGGKMEVVASEGICPWREAEGER